MSKSAQRKLSHFQAGQEIGKEAHEYTLHMLQKAPKFHHFKNFVRGLNLRGLLYLGAVDGFNQADR